MSPTPARPSGKASRGRRPGHAELGARAHARGPRVARGTRSKDGGRSRLPRLKPQRENGMMAGKRRKCDGSAASRWWRRLAVAVGLAACGGGGGIEGGGSTEGRNREARRQAVGQPDHLELAPLHRQGHGPQPSKRRPGSSVKYIEDINSNEEFFSKMQPLLQEGESGGRSIFVLAGYEAQQNVQAGLPGGTSTNRRCRTWKRTSCEPPAPAVRPEPRATRCRGRAA